MAVAMVTEKLQQHTKQRKDLFFNRNYEQYKDWQYQDGSRKFNFVTKPNILETDSITLESKKIFLK